MICPLCDQEVSMTSVPESKHECSLFIRTGYVLCVTECRDPRRCIPMQHWRTHYRVHTEGTAR